MCIIWPLRYSAWKAADDDDVGRYQSGEGCAALTMALTRYSRFNSLNVVNKFSTALFRETLVFDNKGTLCCRHLAGDQPTLREAGPLVWVQIYSAQEFLNMILHIASSQHKTQRCPGKECHFRLPDMCRD